MQFIARFSRQPALVLRLRSAAIIGRVRASKQATQAPTFFSLIQLTLMSTTTTTIMMLLLLMMMLVKFAYNSRTGCWLFLLATSVTCALPFNFSSSWRLKESIPGAATGGASNSHIRFAQSERDNGDREREKEKNSSFFTRTRVSYSISSKKLRRRRRRPGEVCALLTPRGISQCVCATQA